MTIDTPVLKFSKNWSGCGLFQVRHARKSERMTGLGNLHFVQLISVEVRITGIIILKLFIYFSGD